MESRPESDAAMVSPDDIDAGEMQTAGVENPAEMEPSFGGGNAEQGGGGDISDMEPSGAPPAAMAAAPGSSGVSEAPSMRREPWPELQPAQKAHRVGGVPPSGASFSRDMVAAPRAAPQVGAGEPSSDVGEETPEEAGGGFAESAEMHEPQADGVQEAEEEKASCEMVTVFYGTDRVRMSGTSGDGSRQGRILPLGIASAAATLFLALGALGWRRRATWALAAVGFLFVGLMFGYWGWQNWDRVQQVADPGTRYGNERGELEVGICEVSIPEQHQRGEVERPSILRLEVREDVRKHVVLHNTEPKPDDEFYQQLQARVESAPGSEVFVFVHGYNVTFDGAARRTAQIAHDVEFAGAPVFFSWPSQGGLLKYTVDENNAEWAVPHLKQFLLDVSRRSGAKSVSLIAHSMGNRALTSALRELQRELRDDETLFNQVILAAPDIDAEIFRRDLAPALVRSAQRVTLYASSNDQALVASKQVHGYARAGDSGGRIVVIPGIETIDVSMLDTSLLGHSYYGSSDPILLDIRKLIHEALPAAERSWLLPRRHGSLTYWAFEKIRETASRPWREASN